MQPEPRAPTDACVSRRRWLGGALAFGAGWALGSQVDPRWRAAPGRSARAFAWAADRDGGQIYALNADLLIVRAVAVPAPVRVVAQADGGAFVVSASLGPGGVHGLSRVSPRGAAGKPKPMAPLIELVCLGGGRMVLVSGEPDLGAPRRVQLLEPGGIRDIAAPPRVRRAAFDGSQLALLAEQGAVDLLDPRRPDAALHAARPSERGLGLVADGAGGWWYVERGPGARLLRLDSTLATRGVVELGDFAPRVWAADLDRGCVWLFDPEALHLELRDSQGRVVSSQVLESGAVPERLEPLAGGGCWAPAGGALLAFDGSAQPVASQGGFAFLVDVSVIPWRL